MFPIEGGTQLILAVIFGAVFGALLHLGRVTNYNVIVNQFRLVDFTVLRVMLTAILVGGIGVLLLNQVGLADYHIKTANLLAVGLGAGLFGIGMVLYGYCPGTGTAAVGTGSIHALVGFAGMLLGGVLYALSYAWLQENVLPVASLGKIRLSDVTGVAEYFWFAGLTVVALGVFRFLDSKNL